MVEIRRILCPVDFSEHSRRALDRAIAIARSYKSTITVLHVFSPVPLPAFGAGAVVLEPIVLTDVDRERLLADVKAFADTESARGVPIEAVVRGGRTADEIVEQAASMNADLLIIGTHGRSGFERLLLGSVAEKVLRKAGCPVMTVPKEFRDDSANSALYKRILCPLDFSESSLRALKYATSLAQEADGRLTVVHVIAHDFDYTPGIEYAAGLTVGEFLKEREDALRRQLQGAVAAAPEVVNAEALMKHGKPWREVLRVAEEQQSDLIVMGVHGRGAADLVVFGSTTQHVVRSATCPVLTIRHE